MDNHTYDLVKAVSKRADAVWVSDQNIRDSEACGECQKMWQKIKERDKQDLEEMKHLLATHTP